MDKPLAYISEEQQEEFERFLLNRMNLEEETLFQKKLEGNSILESQFQEFKALFFAIEEDGLRKALEDFHNTVPDGKIEKKSNFNLYRIAAGIAIIMALGLWFFNRPPSNERLFEEYFTPDPGLPTVMGSSDNYAFYEAMVDYKRGNYGTAIEKWEKLLKAKTQNDTLSYFLGAAYLANKNVDNAIKSLLPISDDQNSVFYEEINTFLGLAFLKKGEISKAKSAFSKINTKKSEELLSQIK